MNSEPYSKILKRVGVVLLVLALIDVGVMIYFIANRVSYSSSLNLFAVIAGVFLLRGGLRTAALVRWFALFWLAGFMSLIFVVPFIQPLDLSLTELRLSPGRYVADLILYIFLLALLFWIVGQLGLEPVQAAIAKAGIRRRNMRIPVAAGVGLAVLIAVTVPLIANGESAERAKAIAKQQVGPGYQFHVSSIRISTSGHRSSASGVVTAWNQEEVRSIPFSWEDP